MTDETEYRVVETDEGWIVEGTDIVKNSRASAYRAKKKHLLELASAPEPLIDETVIEQATEAEPEVVEESETFVEEPTLEPESPETFTMPTLDSLKGGATGGDAQSKTDDSFLKAFKSAEVKVDKDGNPKIHISSIWQGASPVLSTILEYGDSAIESWAENEGVVPWNKASRASQRAVFVRVLGIVAPKSDIALDPTQVVLVMGLWMYGMPVFKVMSARNKRKKVEKALAATMEEESEVEYLD